MRIDSCADLICVGCWASSGYSVAGCAQLEQKLRQCMDAPVSLALHAQSYHVADLRSATKTKRRTTSTTICRECTPRSRALTSATRSNTRTDTVHHLYTFAYLRQRARDIACAFEEFVATTLDGVLGRLVAIVYILKEGGCITQDA